MKLLSDVLWLSPQPADEKYGAMIIIPEPYRKRLWQGTILALGPGRRPGYNHSRMLPDGHQLLANWWDGETIIPMGLSVGDRVLLHREQAEVEEIDGQEVWICRYPSILAVVDEGTKHLAGDFSMSDTVEKCD